MTNTNVDRLVEEFQAERRRLFDQHTTIGEDRFLREFIDGDFLRSKLTSALSQARQEGREELKENALAVVKEQDFVADDLTWGDTEYNSNAVRYGINLAHENLSALTTEGE